MATEQGKKECKKQPDIWLKNVGMLYLLLFLLYLVKFCNHLLCGTPSIRPEVASLESLYIS
jgi:hypothetical protein